MTAFRWRWASLVLLALASGACDDDEETRDAQGIIGQRDAAERLDAGARFDAANVTTVAVTDDAFVPETVTIPVGGAVRWVYQGSNPHTVTSGTGPADNNVGALFDTPMDAAGDTLEVVFDRPATQPYFCRLHFAEGMTGTVIVQ